MKRTKQLQGVAAGNNKAGAVRLGDILLEIMSGRISPKQGRFEQVTKCWKQLLPGELAKHCQIVEITGGELRVSVDVPSYRYEMQLCCSEILKQLQQQCPGAHIRKIKLISG